MKCPGQDMRFWKPGDIFDTQCPKCGRKVEFFRDEVRRKCGCGHEIVNPKLDFGCAQWCPMPNSASYDTEEAKKGKKRNRGIHSEKELLWK